TVGASGDPLSVACSILSVAEGRNARPCTVRFFGTMDTPRSEVIGSAVAGVAWFVCWGGGGEPAKTTPTKHPDRSSLFMAQSRTVPTVLSKLSTQLERFKRVSCLLLQKHLRPIRTIGRRVTRSRA